MALIVNGEFIDDAEIRAEAAAMRPRHEQLIEMDPVERAIQLREWAKENLIERVLLRQAAEQDLQPIPAEQIEHIVAQMRQEAAGQPGCLNVIDDETLRRDIESRLRMERLLARIWSHVKAPKAQELISYYKKHREQFWVEEMVHAAHIVKNVDETHPQDEALEVLRTAEAELQSGKAFAEVADRYSDCPGNGGDLGWFPRGQMVEEFDNVVFHLQPGQVSPIFRTPFGFHIAQLIERRPAGILSFEEARPQIESLLLEERRQQALEAFVDQLRAKATVEEVKSHRSV
jgi:parvulin-like peptidyl-prolyl isomerase